MPECPIEVAQIRILLEIAENGKDAAAPLSEKYRSSEVDRAAMRGLVFGKDGAFARCVVIDAVGMAGTLEDVEHVLSHILGHERAKWRKAYTERKEFGSGLIPHSADKNDSVREIAMFAISNILERQGSIPNGGGVIGIGIDAEMALVKTSVLDPSAKVRESATKVLSRYGTRGAFTLFFTYMKNAETAKEVPLLAKFSETLGNITEEMKKNRVRGSFLKALLGVSEGSNFIWNLSEMSMLEMYVVSDLKDEFYQVVAREGTKRKGMGGEGNALSMERIRKLMKKLGKDPTASLKRKRMTAEEELKRIVPPEGVRMGGEIVPPPRQMVKKRESVPPRGRTQDDWNYDEVIVSRGPVVDALCAAGRRIKMAFRGTKGPRK